MNAHLAEPTAERIPSVEIPLGIMSVNAKRGTQSKGRIVLVSICFFSLKFFKLTPDNSYINI